MKNKRGLQPQKTSVEARAARWAAELRRRRGHLPKRWDARSQTWCDDWVDNVRKLQESTGAVTMEEMARALADDGQHTIIDEVAPFPDEDTVAVIIGQYRARHPRKEARSSKKA